jgi:glutamate-1-semialdehyde 2,1-aminomutase
VLPCGNSRLTICYEPYTIYADVGRGCRITDVDGIERIDLWNNYSASIHGHCHPAIVEAISTQAGRVTASSMPTAVEISLAELLCERLPSFDKIRFVNSGTEAVMWAVRAARAYTGRIKVAKPEGGFHGGWDLVETSFASAPENWGPANAPASTRFSSDTPQATLDDVVVLPFNDVENSRRLIDKHAHDLAAVLIDPIPARMGWIRATPEYLQMLREICTAKRIVLIFDEVFCFRVGYSGAQGLFGVTPDLTALGKIIGGGLPVGAFGGAEKFMSVFDNSGGKPPLQHGGTNNGNPVVMAAGLTSMNLLTQEQFVHLDALGERLRAGLRDIGARLKVPMQVQGIGSLAAFFLREAPLRNYRDLLADKSHLNTMKAFHRNMLNAGSLLSPWGWFVCSTPMTSGDIDTVLAHTETSLHRIVAH